MNSIILIGTIGVAVFIWMSLIALISQLVLRILHLQPTPLKPLQQVAFFILALGILAILFVFISLPIPVNDNACFPLTDGSHTNRLLAICLLVSGIVTSVVRTLSLVQTHRQGRAAALMLLLPLAGWFSGLLITQYVALDPWHALGSPPEPAIRIVSANTSTVSVEAKSGVVYTCCTDDGAWIQQDSSWQPQASASLNLLTAEPQSGRGRLWNTRYRHGITIPMPPAGVKGAIFFTFDASATLPCSDTKAAPLTPYGAAGITDAGAVWEWRRLESVYDIRPTPRFLLQRENRILLEGGIVGCIIGCIGSAIALWWGRKPAE